MDILPSPGGRKFQSPAANRKSERGLARALSISLFMISPSLDLGGRESVIVDIPNDSGRREGGFIGGGLSKGDSDDSTRNMRNRTDTELGGGRMMRFPD